MFRGSAALIAHLCLIATPALAAPCKTQGHIDAPIAFPKNEPEDVQFARSMVAVILPEVASALPSGLTCTRSTVDTVFGDYVIGGENDDEFPRMAVRADVKQGPAVYLASSPQAPGIFALVVHGQGALTVVKRFYAGIPTDRRLADDIRSALAEDEGIMAYDAERQMVRYGFTPVDGIPPPMENGSRADGTKLSAGPQIMVLGSDLRLLDMADGMRHKPSGFACPSTFEALPVLLMSIDPRPDYLACSYRAGTDLQLREDDPIRYEVTLTKVRPGETTRSVFDQLTASGRAALRIKGDHRPPFAAGPAPAPEFAIFWDTEDAGVQGAWIGKLGGWVVSIRAQYPPNPANDAEAGKVAQTLFDQMGRQVK